MISYLALMFLALLINWIGGFSSGTWIHIKTEMLDAILDQNISVNYWEIFLSLVIAILIGIIGAYISNKKFVFRAFKYLNVTKHYGDEDVWSYIHNSPENEWVIVRDHKYNLAYFCYIMLFSDYGEKRELLLGEVDVLNNEDGSLIYHTDKLYICRDEYELSIEITKTQEKERNNGNQNSETTT